MTFTSRVGEREDVLGIVPKLIGHPGFVTSTKPVPLSKPTTAMSRLFFDSTPPHTALPDRAPKSAIGIRASMSTPRHGYGPDMPDVHATFVDAQLQASPAP